MTAAAGVTLPVITALVPMAHVVDVARSARFYERLGFRVVGTFTPPGEEEPSFARLASGGAALMLVRGHAVDPTQQGIILTLYCDDVQACHAALAAAGVAVGEMTYPAERPRGRFRVSDPDGYDLALTHL